jgi:hypothetical protein
VVVRFTSTEPGGVVSPDSDILLTFSEAMDEDLVVVTLSANASGPVPCDLEWTGDGLDLRVSPRGTLPRDSHYVLQVHGRDLVGNDLDFKGTVFSTPESQTDEWDAVLPGDSGVTLLLLVSVILVVVVLTYAYLRRR